VVTAHRAAVPAVPAVPAVQIIAKLVHSHDDNRPARPRTQARPPRRQP